MVEVRGEGRVMSGMVEWHAHGMAMVWSHPCFDHCLQVHGLVQGVKKYSNDHN
jgi:hypothetical protein